eukprot:5826992-Alexandrium_andersonii.AAC.1
MAFDGTAARVRTASRLASPSACVLISPLPRRPLCSVVMCEVPLSQFVLPFFSRQLRLAWLACVQ